MSRRVTVPGSVQRATKLLPALPAVGPARSLLLSPWLENMLELVVIAQSGIGPRGSQEPGAWLPGLRPNAHGREEQTGWSATGSHVGTHVYSWMQYPVADGEGQRLG